MFDFHSLSVTLVVLRSYVFLIEDAEGDRDRGHKRTLAARGNCGDVVMT